MHSPFVNLIFPNAQVKAINAIIIHRAHGYQIISACKMRIG